MQDEQRNVAAAAHAVTIELEKNPYNLGVGEERERLVQTVHGIMPATPVSAVQQAVRSVIDALGPGKGKQKAAKKPTVSGENGYRDLEGGEPSLSEKERAINAEVDRVLDDVEEQIKTLLQTESYLDDSSSETNDFFACVRVRYHPSAAKAVEEEIREAYSKKFAERHPHRPYFRSHVRYNLNEPFRVNPKSVILTQIFFQWLQNPQTVPMVAGGRR